MERKIKLAKWILMEAKELEKTNDIQAVLNLAQEITRDAISLAEEIVQEENKEAA